MLSTDLYPRRQEADLHKLWHMQQISVLCLPLVKEINFCISNVVSWSLKDVLGDPEQYISSCYCSQRHSRTAVAFKWSHSLKSENNNGKWRMHSPAAAKSCKVLSNPFPRLTSSLPLSESLHRTQILQGLML